MRLHEIGGGQQQRKHEQDGDLLIRGAEVVEQVAVEVGKSRYGADARKEDKDECRDRHGERARRRAQRQDVPRFFVQRLFFCGGSALFLCAGGRRAVRGLRADHRSERAVRGGELFYIFPAVDAELRLGGDALFAVRAFRGAVQPPAAAHAVDCVFNIFRSAGRTVHS